MSLRGAAILAAILASSAASAGAAPSPAEIRAEAARVPAHAQTWYYYGLVGVNEHVPPEIMARYADFIEDGDHGEYAARFKAAGGRYAVAYTDPSFIPYCDPPFTPPAGRCKSEYSRFVTAESGYFHGPDGARVHHYVPGDRQYQEALNPASPAAHRAWRDFTALVKRRAPAIDFLFSDDSGAPLRSGDMSPTSGHFYDYNAAGVEIQSDDAFRDASIAYLGQSALPLILNGGDPHTARAAYGGAIMRQPFVRGNTHEGCFRYERGVKTLEDDRWTNEEDALLENAQMHRWGICFMTGTPTLSNRLYALASWWLTYDPQWSVAAPNRRDPRANLADAGILAGAALPGAQRGLARQRAADRDRSLRSGIRGLLSEPHVARRVRDDRQPDTNSGRDAASRAALRALHGADRRRPAQRRQRDLEPRAPRRARPGHGGGARSLDEALGARHRGRRRGAARRLGSNQRCRAPVGVARRDHDPDARERPRRSRGRRRPAADVRRASRRLAQACSRRRRPRRRGAGARRRAASAAVLRRATRVERRRRRRAGPALVEHRAGRVVGRRDRLFRARAGRPPRGAVSVALAAVSPFLVLYGQQMREYGLWCGLIALSSGAAVVAARRGGFTPWAWYAVASTAALWTSPLSLLLAPAHAVYAAYAGGRRRLVEYVLAYAAALVAYAPWLLVMVEHRTQIAESNAWSATPYSIQALGAKLLFTESSALTDLAYTNRLGIIAAAFALLAIAAAAVYLFRRDRGSLVALGSIALTTALLPLLVDVVAGSHRSARSYLCPLVVVTIVALGCALAQLPRVRSPRPRCWSSWVRFPARSRHRHRCGGTTTATRP